MSGIDLVTRALRPASLLVAGGFRPPEDPSASWLGAALAGASGETRPEGTNGPMAALLQLNLAELPVVPPALADLALLTVYVDLDVLDSVEVPLPNGQGWVVRTYTDATALISLPEGPGTPWKAFPLRAHTITDAPCWEDFSANDPGAATQVLEYERAGGPCYYDLCANLASPPEDVPHKVGGYPDPWQSGSPVATATGAPGHDDDPQFVIQIASDPKAQMQWWDRGSLMIARGGGGRADEWLLGRDFA